MKRSPQLLQSFDSDEECPLEGLGGLGRTFNPLVVFWENYGATVDSSGRCS